MLLLHHAGWNIPGENRTRICLLGGGGSTSVKLQGRRNGGAPGICTPDTLAGATVFRTASSTKPDVLLGKWLPDVDSHHDDPLNRRTCYFHIIGEFARTSEAAEGSSGGWRTGEIAPGTSAVRSGACSISYTLRALLNGRAPRLRSGYLAVPSGADCYLPRARTLDVPDKWRPVRALLPRPSARQAAALRC